MNFFKQAQDFAASANTNTGGENTAAPGASDSGFGSFMGQATNMLNSQAAPADDGSAAPATLPGGRQAPTNQELMQSGQLLFGAARGQKVDSTQLAGAASDILGGLTAHGNLDEGTYGTYINQAEDYLNKYSGQGQSAGGAARAPASQANSDQVPTDSQQAPPANDESDVPAQRTADQSNQFQSPADQTADSAPVNAPSSTDDYAPDKQQARPSASAADDQY